MHELVWIKLNESKCTVKQWNLQYLYILHVSQNKQRLFPYTALTSFFIAKMECVYCAVGSGSLKTIQGNHSLQGVLPHNFYTPTFNTRLNYVAAWAMRFIFIVYNATYKNNKDWSTELDWSGGVFSHPRLAHSLPSVVRYTASLTCGFEKLAEGWPGSIAPNGVG